ncbi:unnamed protein product [Enterobius vermicularis]|uniref:Leishmanolysin-like peptidase n=1 Tax=Enterobius vermicularis TaxID=51028 RepID=A0A0N4UWQ7_ENTVE|nr:unnamed protein product [Enterobius vermicularis]
MSKRARGKRRRRCPTLSDTGLGPDMQSQGNQFSGKETKNHCKRDRAILASAAPCAVTGNERKRDLWEYPATKDLFRHEILHALVIIFGMIERHVQLNWSDKICTRIKPFLLPLGSAEALYATSHYFITMQPFYGDLKTTFCNPQTILAAAADKGFGTINAIREKIPRKRIFPWNMNGHRQWITSYYMDFQDEATGSIEAEDSRKIHLDEYIYGVRFTHSA